MCGIVAAVAKRNIVPILIEGLQRLEYRGYDSAGLAVLNPHLDRLRSTGRVAELAAQAKGMNAEIGIAHTRWATHGVPSERNAHPHVSGGLAVVHNGIIENFAEIKQRLHGVGYTFTSDTDTEVIAHLIEHTLKSTPDLFDAVRLTTCQLAGAYAIAVVCEDEQRIIVARNGAPLMLGIADDGGLYAASDASALLQVTRTMIYLEDGDVAELSRTGYRIVRPDGTPITRASHESSLSADAVELGNYHHYMQKEIFEQPAALANTLEMLGSDASAQSGQSLSPNLFGAAAPEMLRDTKAVLILACGTSYHSGLVARYWIEQLAGIPCTVEIASEYRYRISVANPAQLVVAISQSGETADTLRPSSTPKAVA
jgi:glucosamine--fructose-6-phosphate aminotransferase (isomerizing)